MSHPAYETYRQVTTEAGVLLANNPGLMELEGTNTWILRAPGVASAVVVDPGPLDEAHLANVVAAAGAVEEILLTHRHPDHSAGARRFAELTGAPVRALDPEYRLPRAGQPAGELTGLGEGDVINAAGVQVKVWATPGHTSDSLCFLLGDSVLTGDTILGRGTTIIEHPDGSIGPYLDSLTRLAQLGDLTVLPGHGPELASAGIVAQAYLKHRRERLAQVRAAMVTLGPDATARQVVELVYADVDEALWPAAEKSVEAQLAYLKQYE